MSPSPKWNAVSRRATTWALCASIVALAFFMLAPLSSDLFVRASTNQMVSDGTDPRGLLWGYQIILNTWHDHPSRMFYGAIYTEAMNAPSGHALWMPWCERILVPLLAPITNDTSMATAFGLIFLVSNSFAFFWMSRAFRWPTIVGYAGAVAYGLTPFTRGRVSVHMALTGIHYLPLVIGGLERLASYQTATTDGEPDRKREWRTILVSMLAFFGVATSAHYYLIITVLLLPVLAVFFFVRARSDGWPAFRQRSRMLALAAVLPTTFLAFQFLVPLPSEFKGKLGAFPPADPKVQMQYLQDVGAHPVDYLVGDVKFGHEDIIPLRGKVTKWVREHMDGSHPHERANGIRWTILTCQIAALGYRFARRKEKKLSIDGHRTATGIWLFLGLYAFLFSLSPRGFVVYGEEYAPSLAANFLLPNFRVPCRFGPVVNFAAIAIVADFLTELQQRRWGKRRWIGVVLAPLVAFLVVIEFLPRHKMISSYVRPPIQVSQPDGSCGPGVFLPFSNWDYWAFEETRGTKCTLLNPTSEASAAQLEGMIGGTDFARPGQKDALLAFIRCAGLEWVSFRGNVPAPIREAVCSELGWIKGDALSCRAPAHTPRKKDWRLCR
jgi:hypothetical protein